MSHCRAIGVSGDGGISSGHDVESWKSHYKKLLERRITGEAALFCQSGKPIDPCHSQEKTLGLD
jgi:hypothetical protein